MKDTTTKGVPVSTQISELDNIPIGDFKPDHYFYIKNNSGEGIKLNIKTASSEKIIETTIFPGWNVEICKEVIGNGSNELQWGR